MTMVVTSSPGIGTVVNLNSQKLKSLRSRTPPKLHIKRLFITATRETSTLMINLYEKTFPLKVHETSKK